MSVVYTGEGEESVEREGMSLRGRKACEQLDGFDGRGRREILDQNRSTSYVRGDEREHSQYIYGVEEQRGRTGWVAKTRKKKSPPKGIGILT